MRRIPPTREPPERGRLEIRDLRIGYGDEEILHLPELAFPPRRITALVGPVAAGKSTLLRHIAGLSHLTPSCWHCGEVLLDGARIATGSGDGTEDLVAFLPQKSRLYEGTVLENLGTTRDDPRLAWWIGLLGLHDRIQSKLDWEVGMLSLAGHRIVLLLRMLLGHPRVLLLDEPLTDVAISDEPWVIETLRRLSGRMTVVVITHNKAQARELSDHVALVSGGVLAELTGTGEFFRSPRTELGRGWLESGSAWPAPKWDDEAPSPAPPAHPPALAPRSLGFHWIIPRRLGGMHQPGLLGDLDGDLAVLERLGVNHLVSLTEAPLDTSGVDTRGIRIDHFPIRDMDAPDPARCAELLGRLLESHDGGANIVFHCRGGLGRTGLMLASFLVAQSGTSAHAAIEQIRRLNPNYIQSPRQMDFVLDFPAFWAGWRDSTTRGEAGRDAAPR